jgi:hypothetical protein
MKSRALIAILLLSNFALAAYILSFHRSPAAAKSSEQILSDHSISPKSSHVAKPHKAPPSETPTAASTNTLRWAQLEAEDYPTYIARLRSIGCPEQTIRDIIIADVDKLMAPQVLALTGHTKPPKYWKADVRDSSNLQSLERLNRIADLDVQKRGVIKDLLGIDLAAERLRQKGETDIYEERLSFLPEDKRSQVRILIEKANREEVYLREKSWRDNDELTSAEKNRLQSIQQEKDQALQQILSPAEYDQYNLWFSPSAYKVRDAFYGLDNTEAEFLSVYRLQQDFDSRWGNVQPASLGPSEKQEYDSARAQFDSDLSQLLGPERYAEIKQAQDSDYRQLAQTAADYNLPPGAVREVYALKNLALEQRSKVNTDASLTPEQKQSIFQAINQETERAVAETIGPQALKTYLHSGAGKWISE